MFYRWDYFFIIKIFPILEKKMEISFWLFDWLPIQKGNYNILKVRQIMNINANFKNKILAANIYHGIK